MDMNKLFSHVCALLSKKNCTSLSPLQRAGEGNSTTKNHILRKWQFIALICLTACSTITSIAPTASPRPYYSTIEISGRLSAQYQHNRQAQAIHVGFDWSQTPTQTVISLTSPTGQSLAMLYINERGAQLYPADRPPEFADNADQLLANLLGWPLPITGLRDWLQGFINTIHSPVITAANSEDTFFLVDGWNLRYSAWQVSENHVERPKRLQLIRRTEQVDEVNLRIIIDQWITDGM